MTAHIETAATEIIESHEELHGQLADATCAALHLVFDPDSHDSVDHARAVWSFILEKALPHMLYEEQILFPRAIARGVPAICVDVLREEHDVLRVIAEHLADENVAREPSTHDHGVLLLQFIQIFDKHASREEAVLSLFTDRLLH